MDAITVQAGSSKVRAALRRLARRITGARQIDGPGLVSLNPDPPVPVDRPSGRPFTDADGDLAP